jgi:hypothetical protein
MKSGMDVMPLKATSNEYFWIPFSRHYQCDKWCNLWGGSMIPCDDVITHVLPSISGCMNYSYCHLWVAIWFHIIPTGWRKEHLWNFCVTCKVHVSNLVIKWLLFDAADYYKMKIWWCWLFDDVCMFVCMLRLWAIPLSEAGAMELGHPQVVSYPRGSSGRGLHGSKF